MPTTDWRADSATATTLDRLRRREAEIKRAGEAMLLEIRAQRGADATLTGPEQTRFASYQAELRGIGDRIAEEQDEYDRMGQLPAALRGGGGGARPVRGGTTGAHISPLDPPIEELRRMFEQVHRGLPAAYEHRAPSTADSLLPPELFPQVIGAIHPTRILDRLPSYAIQMPSVEYVRHISTTGTPGTVAEGAVKPSIQLVVDKLVAAAVKVAATVTLTREIIDDWDAFHQYGLTELQRQVIDAEGLQLLTGDGTGTNMTGFYETSGILTHNAAADNAPGETIWDSFERCISELRVGSALAEPDLVILSPEDWSAARRVKDQYGRYLVSPDPSRDEVDSLWGINVIPSTQNPVGQGLFIDTSKFGRVAIRSPLGMFMGFINDDFARNQISWAAEERLVLTVERPAAVLAITNLPAPTAADTKTATKR
jgi:HK97 family phage major capsid protein